MKYYFKREKIFNLILMLIILLSIIIYAHSDGIVGRTQKNGEGCTCHAPNFSPNVLVSIIGPDTLAVGQTALYSITIEGGPLIAGGTNISASNGNLTAVSGDLRKESGELTHTVPKSSSNGKVSFQFQFTAPSAIGNSILFANGNSINFNGSESGDQWNFAANKIITIVQPTNNDDNIFVNSFKLNQNFPNPFNPTTSIEYRVGSTEYVTLKIYDVLGKEVATLVDEERPAGTNEITWNAEGLSSGVYYSQLKAGSFIETKKMILLR